MTCSFPIRVLAHCESSKLKKALRQAETVLLGCVALEEHKDSIQIPTSK